MQAPPEQGPLAEVVGAAEHATFHTGPREALQEIDRGAREVPAGSAERAVLEWLRGVCLGASGDFGEALSVLNSLINTPADTPRGRLVVAYSAATAASLHRQIGRLEAAETLDNHGLAAAEPLGAPAFEAAADCLVGLISDAVGAGDNARAQERLAATVERFDAAGELARWRVRCRLAWARAEVATAIEDSASALRAAQSAQDLAVSNSAPRHVAKSRLYLGVAALTSHDTDAAVTALSDCLSQASQLGCRPLSWRSAALLGAVAARRDPRQATAYLATARADAGAIAEGLSPGLREDWMRRPDVAAVLPG